jgi:hypothetical protein
VLVRRGKRKDWSDKEASNCEKCVAILENVAMLRKNQGMLDGKVAKGMWQSWKMLELQIPRRRAIPARKRNEQWQLQIG